MNQSIEAFRKMCHKDENITLFGNKMLWFIAKEILIDKLKIF